MKYFRMSNVRTFSPIFSQIASCLKLAKKLSRHRLTLKILNLRDQKRQKVLDSKYMGYLSNPLILDPNIIQNRQQNLIFRGSRWIIGNHFSKCHIKINSTHKSICLEEKNKTQMSFFANNTKDPLNFLKRLELFISKTLSWKSNCRDSVQNRKTS